MLYCIFTTMKYSKDFRKIKLKESLSHAKDFTLKSKDKAVSTYGKIKVDIISVMAPFLAVPELLKWSANLTKSTATIYDKALDANYLKTHIGGGNHRLFDGGHDPISAIGRIRDASEDDTFKEEVLGYFTAMWKDVTTTKGLPFVTLDKANYDEYINWFSDKLPFIEKGYYYDLMSFDVFEVFSSSLGAVSFLFVLNNKDQIKLAEMLGSIGITSIISANPIMGVLVIMVAGYAYFIKKHEFEKLAFVKGASLATVSAIIFATLGFPVIFELGIALVVTFLLRKHILDNEAVLYIIKTRSVELGFGVKEYVYIIQKKIFIRIPGKVYEFSPE